MNRFAFALAAWIAFGLEIGLKDALELGPTGIAPSFVFTLAAYVALQAPARAASWACLILGLGMDLLAEIEVYNGGPPVTIPGPNAVGYFLAGQFIVALRGLMMRPNPLTLAFLSATGLGVAQVVVVAVYSLRTAAGSPIAWSATGELLSRMGGALYTGVLAAALSLLLLPLVPLMGFQPGTGRRLTTRIR